MSARTAATFALGFAAGMLTLGVTLWATGQIGVHTHSTPLLPPTGASMPDLRNGNAPVLRPAPLPELIPPAPSPAGSPPPVFGRVPTATPKAAVPRLIMPLALIDAAEIPDTFEDARSGHRHEALDIMAPRGTPVRAVAEGNVAKLFTSKAGGLTVHQFDNARDYCFYYAHLDRYAPGLKQGTLLRQGEVLGYVGSTGDASPDAPHLHFTIFELGPEKKWWEGKAINPLPLLRQSR